MTLMNFKLGGGRFIGVTLSILVLVVMNASGMFAQGTTATIMGTVTDTTGAVIPGVEMEIKNTGTGATRTAITNDQGRYIVEELQIGDYAVQAALAGFQTMIHKGINLTVGSRIAVDFTLQVGQVSETIAVEADVTQVETASAALGSLTDQKQMRELPLNGRNFSQLILLTPGVQTVNGVNPNARQGKELSYSASGARPDGQALLLDGESLQNLYGHGLGSVTGASLGVEAIAEFQTLTNTYSAQFGGNGVAINAASKSGTNMYHGSVYEFLRNSALDARSFFDTQRKPGSDHAEPPPFRRHQFGVSLGGPIVQNKLFFFGNYEGIRQELGQSRVATVPAPNSRTPTFPRANNPAMYDALVNTLALYPQPTSLLPGGTTGQVTMVANQIAHENFFFGRVDYNLSDQNSVFVRYLNDRQYLLDPFTGGGGNGAAGGLPFWGEIDLVRNHFSTIQWRRIVSPTIVNNVRVNFSHPDIDVVPATPLTPALQFFPGAGRADGAITITGLTGLGPGLGVPSNQIQSRYLIADDLLWTHGSQSTRVGVSLTREQSNTFYPFRSGSNWSFQSLTNFLAGIAQQVQGTPVGPQYNSSRYYRVTDITPYLQNDWKVSSKLTLNFGVRWDYLTNPTEKNHNFYVAKVENGVPIGTDLENVDHPNQTNPNTRNFDPRFGFAYDVFADHKTAIRGGFGITHSPVFTGNYNPLFVTVKPWPTFQQLNPSYPVPFTTSTNASLPSFPQGWNWYNNKAPYLMQYNLNIQREVANSTVATIGYVGSRGLDMFTMRDLNPFIATVDANGVYHFSSTRLNPALASLAAASNGSSSNYNSLQLMLNRAFTSNIGAQASYTWSRCIDDGGSPVGSLTGANTPSIYTNPYDRSIDRGLCYFNVDHTFRASTVIGLPFRGNRLVEGWQFTTIVSANGGLPMTVSTGFDRAFVGGGGRPNYVSGCKVQVGRVDQWYDPNCFTLQDPGTIGNLGRNTVIGPGLVNVDVALLKDTNLTERVRAQFRAEVFNIPNHPNFALPAASIFTASGRNPTAGQITGIVTSPRQIQFAMKLIF